MAEKKQSKPEKLKNTNEIPSFELKDFITILLLIFVYPIGLISMWFVTKWPKWIKLLLSLPAVFTIIAMSLITFFIYKLITSDQFNFQPPQNNYVFCTQDVKLCPDGETYVGREGPKCEFAKCPQTEPGYIPTTEEKSKPSETSVNDSEDVLPTIAKEQ